MNNSIRFSRRIFFFSAVYGLLILLPQYFMENKIGLDYPPAITHPEHFYGFVGLAVVWQLAFLLIASDVIYYRKLMLIAVLEKFSFGLPVVVLYAQSRIQLPILVLALFDMFLGLLFIVAFLRLSVKRQLI